MNSEAKLSCKRLWKLYGSEPDRFFARHNNQPEQVDITDGGYICAVREVTFDVYPGEIVVVMGLSGSGKSTLVRCLSRLIEPTGGEITFEGQNLLAASRKEMIEIRRHKMGMVFQHFALLPHRTVIDNIAFPLEVQGVSRAKRHERAREIIDLVGLSGRERYYPRELSGGQQQRLCIARALAVEPDILLMDEPCSALDPVATAKVEELIHTLKDRYTIVIVTHNMQQAARVSEKTAFFYLGKLIEMNATDQIFMSPEKEQTEAYISGRFG